VLVDSLQKIVAAAIHDQTIPGCVIGAIDAHGRRIICPFGQFTYEPDSPVCQADTLYDVASVTKAIPTATLALKALEQGRIELRTPVADWIPELANSGSREVTLWHLLTHTLDFGYSLAALKDLPAEQLLATIFTREFRSPPGRCFSYSNASSILLGILVERVLGGRLDRLADRYLFRPLDMDRTSFHPQIFPQDEIVPTEDDPWRHGMVRGCVHDESAYRLQQIMVPGSAGLFTTVPDLLNFLQMLLENGSFGAKTILSSSTVDSLQVNQLTELGESAALGWELNRRRYMGTAASDRTIGKTGFTGCVVMCDFEKRRALTVLSNYPYPHRKADASRINAVRAAIADQVFGLPGW
jgi:CubicO group peptidase (beta-lactamase class C family)